MKIEMNEVLLNIARKDEREQTVADLTRSFARKEVENKLITIALASTDGHRVKAAKLLGMSIRSLYRKIWERRNNENGLVVDERNCE